jgi:uncharacterized repeat protein (TIGR01451 family)
MTERTSWKGSARRSLRNCIVPIAAALLILTVPAALATPEPAYNLVWEQTPAGSFVGTNAPLGLRLQFPSSGVRVLPLSGSTPGWEFGLSWSGYGTAGAVDPVGAATVEVLDNRATYTRSGAPLEWYLNTPVGLEHWFAFDAAPSGAASSLVLQFAVTGGLTADSEPVLSMDGIALHPAYGGTAVTYSVLSAAGAGGNQLATSITPVLNAQGVVTGITVVVSADVSDYPVNLGMRVGNPPAGSREIVGEAEEEEEVPPPNPLAASANDLCSGAQIIPSAGPFPYLTTVVNIAENTNAGDPPAPTCALGGNAANGAAWYSFTPAISGVYTFNDCVTQAPGTTHDDTIIAIYSSSTSDCSGTLTQLGCGDDLCTTASCAACVSGFLSSATAFLNPGQTYFILVWNWAPQLPQFGNVQMQVTRTPGAPNDSCLGTVTNVPLNRTVNSTNLGALNDYQISSTACFTGIGNNPIGGTCLGTGRDVVFKFTAPAAGLYSLRARDAVTAASSNLSIYTSNTCPNPGIIGCPGGTVDASNKNPFTSPGWASREEITCTPLTTGQTIYAIVDECATTAGGPISIEAEACFPEAEPNDTPATASTGPASFQSPVTGRISGAADVDFFNLGTPAAGARIFAYLDADSSYSSLAPNPNVMGFTGDFDLRVTTSTDTLEFDARDADAENGGESGAISGRAAPGGVPVYLRVNNASAAPPAPAIAVGGEPYLVYAAIQPPGGGLFQTSASIEANEGTNGTVAGAESAANLYWQGGFHINTDVDFFRICAATGDMIVGQMDNDPGRNAAVPGRANMQMFSAITSAAIGYAASNPSSAANQSSSALSGAGSLTATTPFTTSEVHAWRAEYDGPHYARLANFAGPVAVAGSNYLYSVTVNGQTGAEQSSEIQVTKAAPDTIGAGGLIIYEMTLTNNGPNIATSTAFFDRMPEGTAFIDWLLLGADDLFGFCDVPPTGDVGGTVTCTLDCLPAGRTVTILIAAQVFQCIGEGFVVSNTITAESVSNLTPGSVLEAVYNTTVTDDGSCEFDGDACTVDSCVEGVCTQGGPPNCDDGNTCTDDACDSEEGCVNTNNTNSCSDGNACTVGDSCVDGGCVPGSTPLVCNDGNECTDDACDPGSGCVTTNNNNTCDDGDPSTVNDVCRGGTCNGCEIGARPKVVGYYHSLCNSPHSGDQLTAADAACVAGLSTTFAGVTSVADICAALHTTGSDKCDKAEESLMAMALNICKNKVCPDQGIDSACSTYETVGDSFAAADAALSDPGRTNATCDAAGCQAKEVNNGESLQLNSLAITHVAGEIRLDWEAPILVNANQLHGYKIWRRAVGSSGPFTQIGTSETPHFVDPTGMSGNFQYEIQAY